MTRTQVTRVILTEVLILAAIGTVLGAVVSPLLGHGLIGLIKQIMGQILAFGDASPRLTMIVFAVVFGIGITLLSVLILVLTYGLNSFGIMSADLHRAAIASAAPTLVIGVVGMIAAPLIAAAAAWLPTRSVIDEPPAVIMPQAG